jgi:hypothetical protein
MSARPKLVPGHTYRFTFTRSEWYAERHGKTHPYTLDIEVTGTGGTNPPKAVTLWANRWCARGKHTVEIEELANESSSEVVTPL